MKLALNSELWGRIFYNLREEFYNLNPDEYNNLGRPRDHLRMFLLEYSVHIESDSDGRWEEVEIVLSDEELTLFLLRWI